MNTINFHYKKVLPPTFTKYSAPILSTLHHVSTEKALATTKLKKTNPQKMLKLSVPHIGLQFYPCYCPEGITGVLLQSQKSGQGWEAACLIKVDRQWKCQEVKPHNHNLTLLQATKPGLSSTETNQINYKTFELATSQVLPKLLKIILKKLSSLIGSV